jgi:hypothetical protein
MITLTNVGSTYDTTTCPQSKGLGIQDIDFTGVTSIVFRVHYNKIGTGTLSWQLWNDTDSAELARIDDAAAAADNKKGSVTAAVALSGEKTVRVRCKSTQAADDPVFYGASVLTRA